MPIKFTRHALQQMQNRRIKKDEVIKTINDPEKLAKNSGNNLIVQRMFEGKFLLVFYRVEEEDKIIITAYKTTKLEKYI